MKKHILNSLFCVSMGFLIYGCNPQKSYANVPNRNVQKLYEDDAMAAYKIRVDTSEYIIAIKFNNGGVSIVKHK